MNQIEAEIKNEVISKNLDSDQIEYFQDLEKQFQEKLVKLYCTDVNQAKTFYYQEKLKIDLSSNNGQNEFNHLFEKYLEGLQWVLYYYYK